MKLVGSGLQQIRHYLYYADGSVASGGVPQLVLGQSQARSFLKLQNLSAGPLYFEFGAARATATLTGAAVTSITVTNAGFNYSKAPVVRFDGGGIPLPQYTNYIGLAQPNAPAPSNVAVAHCVMTGAAPNLSVSSIVIDNPGSGYVVAPFVFLMNSDLDPNGCAIPSATSGMLLNSQSDPYILNGTACFTDPIAVYGATTGQAFICRWMD